MGKRRPLSRTAGIALKRDGTTLQKPAGQAGELGIVEQRQQIRPAIHVGQGLGEEMSLGAAFQELDEHLPRAPLDAVQQRPGLTPAADEVDAAVQGRSENGLPGAQRGKGGGEVTAGDPWRVRAHGHDFAVTEGARVREGVAETLGEGLPPLRQHARALGKAARPRIAGDDQVHSQVHIGHRESRRDGSPAQEIEQRLRPRKPLVAGFTGGRLGEEQDGAASHERSRIS